MADEESRAIGATKALLAYFDDHYAHLSFNAYLWKLVVMVEYGRGSQPQSSLVGPAGPIPMPPPMPRSGTVTEMDQHTQYLSELLFCRGVDSFIIYLGDLLATIFRAKPDLLKSKEDGLSAEFVLEHYERQDLISALAEKKADNIVKQSMKDIAKYFEKMLDGPMFETPAMLNQLILYSHMRNLIVHKRGIVDRKFLNEHSDYPATLGSPIPFPSDMQVAEILGMLVYLAKQLDGRAILKFDLISDDRAY